MELPPLDVSCKWREGMKRKKTMKSGQYWLSNLDKMSEVVPGKQKKYHKEGW